MFQDQLKHLAQAEFILGLADLELLKDQMQRCWSFVKQTAAAGNSNRQPPVSATSATSIAAIDLTTSTASATPQTRLASDPFSLMAQRNSGLRVEDLKPPPVKARKSISTPSGAGLGGSPSFLPGNFIDSPSPLNAPTPSDTADSPPKDSRPRITKGAKALATTQGKGKSTPASRKLAAAAAVSLAGSATKAATPRLEDLYGLPSPARGDVAESPTPLMLMEDAIATGKRRRELDEAEQNPDVFIESTLRRMDRSTMATTMRLAGGITQHLPFHFDPLIPAALPLNSSSDPPLRLSFLSQNSTATPESTMPVFSASTSTSREPPRPFDFNFFIDSSAAGFEDDDASTPDLISTFEESPPSDEDTLPPSSVKSVFSALPSLSLTSGPLLSGNDVTDRKVDDYDPWFSSGNLEEAQEDLPVGFAWEGESWQIN
jgi:hypothetical protein